MSHMLMHMLVRQCIPPHEASQIRMTPCNRFKTRANQGKSTPPAKAQPISSYTAAKPPASGPPRLLRTLSHPLHAFHQAARFSKKGSGIGVSKRRFLFSKPHVVLGLSDSPGREGYKERSGEVRGRGCHHVEEKGFVDFSSEIPRSSIIVSWFVIVQDKWKRGEEKKEEKKKRRYKGDGWYQCRAPKALTPEGSHS